MYSTKRLYLFAILLFLSTSFLQAQNRYDVLEDFDSGEISLLSWMDEDVQPNSWELDSLITYDNSAYSLKLFGNTWKQQIINPVSVDSGAVFQVAARTQSGARYQGIGFNDGTNTLFYSFSGTAILDLEVWVPVYEGQYSANTWGIYQLPIADDWWSFFEYLPIITSIIYVNDLDGVGSRSVWFDSIYDISSDLPIVPQVSIDYAITTTYINNNFNRVVGVQFTSSVIDLDSTEFTYHWDFGDSTFSDVPNPYHLFTATDNRDWRVTLKVTDESGRWGLASCMVPVDEGVGTLPITLNFVGDVMLARRYESAGGIIPTLGVNAIFQPTRHLLGEAADITVANLEVPLTNQGTPHPTKSVVYRGNPANVSGLVYAGIDIVSLANNHTMDYMLPGLLQTQQVLDQAGILYSGSGVNSYEAYTPAFINKNGLNIAFLRSSDRTGQYNNTQPYLHAGYNRPGFAYMTPYYIGRQIENVEGIADLKIVEMHAGSEYSLGPGEDYGKNNPFLEDTQDEEYNYRTDVPHMWDIAIRQYAIDRGADLVIVHHPHIIQALEIYNGKLIAHSLGNFVFDLDYPETMHSMILYADADVDGFSNYRVVPIYINDYIPVRATGQLGIYTLDYLAMRSTERNTVFWVDKNEEIGKVIVNPDEAVILNHKNITQQQLAPAPNNLNETPPFKLSRCGSIASIDAVTPVYDAQARLGRETVWFGNFEDEGSTLWDVPEFSDSDVFDGLRSAMLQPSLGQTQTATTKRRFKWYDNTKSFTLHGWIKGRNISAANIQIRYYSSRTSGVIGSEFVSADVTGTTAWSWFSKELTLPANAYFFDLRLTATNNLGGAARALFDNVGLIEWTAWQDAAQMTAIPYPNDYYWAQARSAEQAKSIHINYTEKDFLPEVPRPQRAKELSPLLSLQNYPNPFNSETTIAFDLDSSVNTRVSIYNIRGQKVNTLIDDVLPQGKHQIVWKGRDSKGNSVASGIYLIRIENGRHNQIRKMMLMK